MLNLIIIGPPGVGKGTQAKKIASKYCIPHISTGDILRKNINDKTTLGRQAEAYIENGLLVPDNLVLGVLFNRLASGDCKKGFILDGFPRNLSQAQNLDEQLSVNGWRISSVVVVEAPPEIIIERISGRLLCQQCGEVYHISTNAPGNQNGICNRCGGSLYQRKDDKKETVKRRLEVYYKETAPLINYYNEQHLCMKVNGRQEISHVFQDICNQIGNRTRITG